MREPHGPRASAVQHSVAAQESLSARIAPATRSSSSHSTSTGCPVSAASGVERIAIWGGGEAGGESRQAQAAVDSLATVGRGQGACCSALAAASSELGPCSWCHRCAAGLLLLLLRHGSRAP